MTVAAACFVDRENVLYDLRRAAATSSLSFKCKKEQNFSGSLLIVCGWTTLELAQAIVKHNWNTADFPSLLLICWRLFTTIGAFCEGGFRPHDWKA